jgi:hypothetical protein
MSHAPLTTTGFTLFEVGISLAIVTTGVLSVMMLMPVGIKTQQVARYQILASAKAIEIISVNANQWRKWDEQRLEGQRLAECSINNIAHSPLVEQKACNYRHGSLPVPPEIARRLDSDNDEIQRILNQGGYLFYSSPRPIQSMNEGTVTIEDKEVPNETQKLVYAYVGHAQQPALASHPLKAWPYYDWYPAPPRARLTTDNSSPVSRHEDSWRLNNWPSLTEFLAVCSAWKTVAPTAAAGASRDNIVAYRDKAKLLVAALGMPRDLDDIPNPPPGTALEPVEPYRVLATSYLAHAMMWLTRQPLAPTAAEIAQAQKAHESAMQWLYRHQSTSPYDWGIDRALNFQNGWDHPLLQYQLFKPPALGGDLADNVYTNPNGDLSWRVLTAQPVVNAGTSNSYGVRSVLAPHLGPAVDPRPSGNKPEIDDSWGQQIPGQEDTFNLTAPFHPSERCRQLVFWVVDWKSYADAETVPSAPQDASRFPYDSEGRFSYHNHAHKFNNPEVFFVWKTKDRNSNNTSPPEGTSNVANYLGLHGADRNGNRRLDIGPVPASARLRATTVARFNLYQPRVWSGLRN